MTGLEEVFRDAWAAVVASTARLTRDLDLAEDCAQEAVERALRTWPSGMPDNPAGWLTTTAHRIALDPAAARGDAAAQAAAARGAAG
jgi:RNA polymerase sigma-70 factor (ECF subfamily)